MTNFRIATCDTVQAKRLWHSVNTPSETPPTLKSALGENPSISVVAKKDGTEVCLELERAGEPVQYNEATGIVTLYVKYGDVRCMAFLRLPAAPELIAGGAAMIIHTSWSNQIMAIARHRQSQLAPTG